MNNSLRVAASTVLQLTALSIFGIYSYVSSQYNPLNYYWLAAVILIFLIGRFRSFQMAMFTCLVVLMAYGSIVIYRSLTMPDIEVGWNELIWLFAFPFGASMGGIRQFQEQSAESLLSFINLGSNYDATNQTPIIVDEDLDYMSGTAFMYKLEEEVLHALRERQKFYLVMVEIESYRDFKRLVGFDQGQLLLNSVAGWFKNFTPVARAQAGEAVLAGIIRDSEFDSLASVQTELDHQFYEYLLSRPRRESAVKIRLKYGSAVCPTDGLEAKTLMEKASNELLWNENE